MILYYKDYPHTTICGGVTSAFDIKNIVCIYRLHSREEKSDIDSFGIFFDFLKEIRGHGSSWWYDSKEERDLVFEKVVRDWQKSQ